MGSTDVVMLSPSASSRLLWVSASPVRANRVAEGQSFGLPQTHRNDFPMVAYNETKSKKKKEEKKSEKSHHLDLPKSDSEQHSGDERDHRGRRPISCFSHQKPRKCFWIIGHNQSICCYVKHFSSAEPQCVPAGAQRPIEAHSLSFISIISEVCAMPP